jgi:hypothetical protein
MASWVALFAGWERIWYLVSGIQICICCAHRLTKATGKYEKITYVLLILFYLCIKFQIQIYYNLAVTKKLKFLTDLSI